MTKHKKPFVLYFGGPKDGCFEEWFFDEVPQFPRTVSVVVPCDLPGSLGVSLHEYDNVARIPSADGVICHLLRHENYPKTPIMGSMLLRAFQKIENRKLEVGN